MAAQQKVRIPLPTEFKHLTPIERLAVGRKVIDFILERTAKGRDKNNEEFKSVKNKKKLKGDYTKQYAESLDFKNAGKKPSPINLELSGEMLASIKLLKFDKAGEITIGLKKGDPENGKMEGNRKGTYGQKTPVAPPRDPLGITDDDLRAIVRSIDVQGKKTTKQIEDARDELLGTLKPLDGAKIKNGEVDDLNVSLDFRALKKVRRDIQRLERELEDAEANDA